jgi:hypothetical protein
MTSTSHRQQNMSQAAHHVRPAGKAVWQVGSDEKEGQVLLVSAVKHEKHGPQTSKIKCPHCQ